MTACPKNELSCAVPVWAWNKSLDHYGCFQNNISLDIYFLNTGHEWPNHKRSSHASSIDTNSTDVMRSPLLIGAECCLGRAVDCLMLGTHTDRYHQSTMWYIHERSHEVEFWKFGKLSDGNKKNQFNSDIVTFAFPYYFPFCVSGIDVLVFIFNEVVFPQMERGWAGIWVTASVQDRRAEHWGERCVWSYHIRVCQSNGRQQYQVSV